MDHQALRDWCAKWSNHYWIAVECQKVLNERDQFERRVKELETERDKSFAEICSILESATNPKRFWAAAMTCRGTYREQGVRHLGIGILEAESAGSAQLRVLEQLLKDFPEAEDWSDHHVEIVEIAEDIQQGKDNTS